MKDNLEQFVKDNRAGFDDLEPTDQLWKKIQQDLEPQRNYQWMWKVAAILLFGVTIGLLVERNFMNDQNSETVVQIPSELVEAEQFYVRTISMKRQEIEAMIDEKKIVRSPIIGGYRSAGFDV